MPANIFKSKKLFAPPVFCVIVLSPPIASKVNLPVLGVNVPPFSSQDPPTVCASLVPAVNVPGASIVKLPSKSITLFSAPTFVISSVPLVIVKLPLTSKGV